MTLTEQILLTRRALRIAQAFRESLDDYAHDELVASFIPRADARIAEIAGGLADLEALAALEAPGPETLQ